MATTKGHIISNVDKVLDDLKTHLELPGPHVIFFTTDPDPDTGVPWCPDCARSESVIREEVLGAGGSLLEVRVGARSAWRDPDHPFRQDCKLRLTGVPTLLLRGPDGPLARLGHPLEKARTADEARALVKAFLSHAKDHEEKAEASQD